MPLPFSRKPFLPSFFSMFRFSQLIYFALIGKQSNLPYLRRDAVLVRFIHSFLVSAPHLVLHLYVTLVAISPTTAAPTNSYPIPLSPLSPAVLSALAISVISVLYSTLSFSTSDRVSGKNRRVIMPAHVTQVLWYLCMLASRLIALALFAYLYHYYVFVLIGAHCITMLVLLLAQRTTFCADLERLPDGELKFTQRWLLEIPFDIIASVMYVFIHFNLKRGPTKIWAGIYHLLVLAENTTMAALIYVSCSRDGVTSLLFFPVITLALVIGLYVAGIFFMLCYYILYHPKRTDCCFWVGLPKKCCPCCLSESAKEEWGRGTNLRSQVGNGVVFISEPTLVSHNGFVPRNLMPVGPRASEAAAEMASTDGVSCGAISEGAATNQCTHHTQSMNALNGRACREDCISDMDARLSSSLIISANSARNGLVGARRGGRGRRTGEVEHDDTTSTGHMNSSVDTPIYATPRSCRTQTLSISNAARLLSGSNNAFSDGLASELDTIIDSPLFESSLITSDTRFSHKSHRSESGGVGKGRGGKDVDSQRSCTDDTGIDMDSDPQLTQGTTGDINSAGREKSGSVLYEDGYEYGGEVNLPIFTDSPANRHRHQYNPDGSRLQLYSSAEMEDDQVLLPPPTQFQEPNHYYSNHAHQNSIDNRDSVTPTLPTPTYSSPSPAELTPSSHRKQIGKITSSDSQSSHNPKSPIGARTFQGGSSDDVAGSGSPMKQFLSVNSMGGLAQSSPQILSCGSVQRAPRSPKGARRLLVQQHQQLSSSTCPMSKDVADKSKDSPSGSRTPPLPPPILPKDNSNERSPHDELAQAPTSSLVPLTTTETARRAISSSPFFKPQVKRQAHMAPSTERISRNPHPLSRSPAQLSQEISNYRRPVSRDRQHQQRSKYESWHSERGLDSNNSPNLRGKRMSGVEGTARLNFYPVQSTISAFTRIPQDRNSPHHQHVYPRSQSRPSQSNPPRGGQSLGMENYAGRIPRLNKQGSVGPAHHNNHHLRSHQAHPPHYPRHPQGAMLNALRPMSRTPPRNRLTSVPSRTRLKNTDSVDKPSSSSKPSARSVSADIASSNQNKVNRNSTKSPGLYDKLECEKTTEERTQQQRASVPPVRTDHEVSQPRPHSHHQTLYAPMSSAHESAV